MASRFLIHGTTIACMALAGLPAFAQTDIKAVVVKHLKTSRDFTLKVAEQMPEADFGFKLTPPQMSFAEQITHLAQEQAEFLAPFSNDKPNPGKPASMNKKDVLAYVRQRFDDSIDKVSKLTPAQIAKTYNSGEGTMTGLELLMFMMDHTTHHRASAEMYLRAKGITPAEYQF
ncbi:MAG: DinB family protein [Acidobacteriia bacterium]|nr:DinB family protein [Terriglobia bacterium]